MPPAVVERADAILPGGVLSCHVQRRLLVAQVDSETRVSLPDLQTYEIRLIRDGWVRVVQGTYKKRKILRLHVCNVHNADVMNDIADQPKQHF